MRVLHVAECIGGVDRYLRSLLKYSTCENIMILSQLYKKEDFEKLVDHVEIMHMTHRIGVKALVEAEELRGKIKKYKPDVVYAHSSIAGAITRMACVGLGVKVVYNPHGWSFNMESKKKSFFVVVEKLMAQFCDAIICISEAEKVSALREKICKEDKLHVIENGIDIAEYKEESVEFPIPEDAFVVGMVGRISRQKAPDVFIRMAGEVQKEIKNARFIIVGDVIEGAAEERKEIEQLAESLGVDLLITGWVDNSMAYMSQFDVGCLLSRWEGFGLAIPEYMLTGTPIVATKVDAIPYLINDGENGFLVEKDDWKAAAGRVVELANDADMRKEMIENGQRTVRERFDARRVAKSHDDLLLGLIGEVKHDINFLTGSLAYRGHKTGVHYFHEKLIEKALEDRQFNTKISFYNKKEKVLKFVPGNVAEKSNLSFSNKFTRVLTYFLPIELFFGPADIYVCDGLLPHIKKGKKRVAIIFDLMVKVFPENYGRIKRFYLDNYFRQCRKADVIITISETTKQDIVRYLNIPEEKIIVVSCGYTEKKESDSISKEINEIIDDRYLFYVGDMRKNKNLLSAIKGFEKAYRNDKSLKFYIAGKKNEEYESLQAYVDKQGLHGIVKFLGYISNAEKETLYKNSLALLFVSQYEGFGIPILEAALYKTPVITSNCSSMKEIAYGYSLLVDPNNTEDIQNAILSLNDEEVRQKIIYNQEILLRKYTWDEMYCGFKKAIHYLYEESY